MPSRSESSLEKDEFNFAFMLAHDLQEFITSECIELTIQQRLDILSISLRLTNQGTTYPKDLTEINEILGTERAARLKQNAELKARLETDLVNS